MVSDGIKAAQIQAQYSPLINSTWAASSSQPANVLAAIKHAAARLNPRWRGHRPAGRHAAPGRSFSGRRHAPRLPDQHQYRCRIPYGSHAANRIDGQFRMP
jgi:hypothetical protein